MRKKSFSLLLILTLIITLTACTNSGQKDENKLEESNKVEVSKIDITKELNLDDYNLVTNVDFNFDGHEHSAIELYTTAVKNNAGEFIMDDGQDWLLIAKSNAGSYVLFKDFIQIGNIDFNVFTMDDDFYVVTKVTGTANLNIGEYKYDKDTKTFIYKEEYQTNGNVNMIY